LFEDESRLDGNEYRIGEKIKNGSFAVTSLLHQRHNKWSIGKVYGELYWVKPEFL